MKRKIQKRLSVAKVEIDAADTYDYVVINDIVSRGCQKYPASSLREKLRTIRFKNNVHNHI